jgi:hypothetical protein
MPSGDLEAIFDQKEGQYLRRIAVFPLTRVGRKQRHAKLRILITGWQALLCEDDK